MIGLRNKPILIPLEATGCGHGTNGNAHSESLFPQSGRDPDRTACAAAQTEQRCPASRHSGCKTAVSKKSFPQCIQFGPQRRSRRFQTVEQVLGYHTEIAPANRFEKRMRTTNATFVKRHTIAIHLGSGQPERRLEQDEMETGQTGNRLDPFPATAAKTGPADEKQRDIATDPPPDLRQIHPAQPEVPTPVGQKKCRCGIAGTAAKPCLRWDTFEECDGRSASFAGYGS